MAKRQVKKMNSNHPILLMTACINPNGMSNTACQNKNIREVQYLEALNFYLSNTKFNILFVENSGIDISGRYREVIKKGRLEVITFDGNHYDRKLGKGFGEGLILKQAFEKSDLLKTSKVVIKVSGRHIVKNINLIWKSIQFIKYKDWSWRILLLRP